MSIQNLTARHRDSIQHDDIFGEVRPDPDEDTLLLAQQRRRMRRTRRRLQLDELAWRGAEGTYDKIATFCEGVKAEYV